MSEPFSSTVEQQIRDAIEQGIFDHLAGKGRPLDLGGNPFEDPLAGTMRRILRDHGCSHPFLEARRVIKQEVEDYRTALRRAWEAFQGHRSEPAWERAKTVFRERIRQVNRQIKLNNLKAPLPNFHMCVVDAEAEIGKVQLR